MQRRGGVLIGLVVGLVLVACGSFGADGPPADLPDGGSSGVVDGGGGGSTSDRVADGEAGPPISFTCPGYCASFDEGDVAAGWAPKSLGDSQITTGDGHASTRSFRSVVKESASKETREARLVKTFTNIASLTCHFWFRAVTANNDTDLFKLVYGTDGLDEQAVWLDSRLNDTRSCPSYAVLPALGAAWRQVSFTLDGSTTNSVLRLKYDDTLVVTESLSMPGPYPVVTLLLGAYTNEIVGSVLEFDDVICDRP